MQDEAADYVHPSPDRGGKEWPTHEALVPRRQRMTRAPSIAGEEAIMARPIYSPSRGYDLGQMTLAAKRLSEFMDPFLMDLCFMPSRQASVTDRGSQGPSVSAPTAS